MSVLSSTVSTGVALFAASAATLLMGQRSTDPSSGTHGDKSSTNLHPDVRRVLSFWFDGDVNENYKTKWFPSSNKDIQQHADRTIRDQFKDLLDNALNDELGPWGQSIKAILAKIIILDQFSRHIFRSLPSDAIERRKADAKALSMAESLISNDKWSESLTTSEFVFALMPLRHSNTLHRLLTVLELIERRGEAHNKDAELLSKFQKQTTRRVQALQDREKAVSAGDIVDHHYFDADESDILSNPLLVTVKRFIERYHHGRAIAISLSGGVDSMVIAKILAVLRDDDMIKKERGLSTGSEPMSSPTEIVAMHIDYGNRPESSEEATFVHEYATNKLKLSWRIRTITEVTRGVTDRSDYEKISRNIRYSFYKDVLRDCGGLGVIFGHHLGDVQENVISNVMRGCSSLYLSGMTEVGHSEGVAVWRPLLNHGKDEIYKFAHRYGVPYLQDTTPSWSTRGKLRNALVPLLMDIYGTGCLHNLSSLAIESDGMRSLVQENIFDPFMKSVERYPAGVSVRITEHYRTQSAVFWAEALKQIMHSMSMSLVREKAVLNFMDRIKRSAAKAGTTRNKHEHHVSFQKNFDSDKDESSSCAYHIPSGWLELRKGFNIFIDTENRLCILKPGALRPSGSANRNRETKQSSPGNAPVVDICCMSQGRNLISSSGDNGIEVEIKSLNSKTDTVCLKLTTPAEEVFQTEAVLLETLVSPTHKDGFSLLYTTSDSTPSWTSLLASLDIPTMNCFVLEIGVWIIQVTICPCITRAASASVAERAGGALSPMSMTESEVDEDGEGIWKWSPGVVPSRTASPEPVPKAELSDIYDILSGNFSYQFPVYAHNCTPRASLETANTLEPLEAIIPLKLIAGITGNSVRNLHMDSLRNVDLKIREGIPIICPVNVSEDVTLTNSKSKKISTEGVRQICAVNVEYIYNAALSPQHV